LYSFLPRSPTLLDAADSVDGRQVGQQARHRPILVVKKAARLEVLRRTA
jgi:hypothetical protein